MKTAIIQIFIFTYLITIKPLIALNITKDTQWSGRIIIKEDIIVHPNVTLSIVPGTFIIFDPQKDLQHSGKSPELIEVIVRGRILAEGRKHEKIVFTSGAKSPRMSDWYGIVVQNPQQNSTFTYCVVKYAYKGISCYRSSPRIINCELKYNQYAAISCEVISSPYIQKTLILGNAFSGINCELSSRPIVERSIITQNSHGIIVFNNSKPDLGTSKIKKTSLTGKKQSVGENFIFNNFKMNVYNESANIINAQNNNWNTQNKTEIQANLYDKKDNPHKGEIVFLPIFEKKKPKSSPPPKIRKAFSNNISLVVHKKIRKSPNLRLSKKQSQKKQSQEKQSQEKQSQEKQSQENSLLLDSISVKAYRKNWASHIEKKDDLFSHLSMLPTSAGDHQDTPLLEIQLDQGARQYVKRAKPRYPVAYLQTLREGKVWLEVIIAKDGSVETYTILKSDGKYFTKAAVKAVKHFRYKPGTHKGKPVRFKAVEPFVFRFKSTEN